MVRITVMIKVLYLDIFHNYKSTKKIFLIAFTGMSRIFHKILFNNNSRCLKKGVFSSSVGALFASRHPYMTRHCSLSKCFHNFYEPEYPAYVIIIVMNGLTKFHISNFLPKKNLRVCLKSSF